MAIIFSGTTQRVIFRNDETGFAVVSFQVTETNASEPRVGATVTAAGTLPPLAEGEEAQITGEWQTHPRFGKQINALLCVRALPADPQALTDYLGSGLIEGVGEGLAARIIAHFGAETKRVLDEAPERLTEVSGIGQKKMAQIRAAWGERKSMNDAFTFLFGVGLRCGMAQRIWNEYGAETIERVRTDPYQLVRDVELVGFKRADDIGRALGIPADSPFRAQAGILHLLQEAATTQGHVYLPLDELRRRAVALLAVQPEVVQTALDVLEQDQATVTEDLKPLGRAERATYRSWMWTMEVFVAQKLVELAERPRVGPQIWKTMASDLTDEQQQAVENALRFPVSAITGGPGTGKTFITRAIVRLAQAQGWTVSLAAPTGRAAKRLSEATQCDAVTLHRLLELQPGGSPGRDQDRPIECDLLIVDEASMIDLGLMFHLLNAIPKRTALIFIGDADQLPSVGAGTVLRDLLESQRIPSARLTQIMRQEEGSPIVRGAHAVRMGSAPVFGVQGGELSLIETDGEQIDQRVLTEVVRALEQKIPLDEIQVLAPMYRGAGGVDALNQLLQARFNPPHPDRRQHALGERVFREGDKVLQTRNNYEKDVVNGDIGILASLNVQAKFLVVNFNTVMVRYNFDELDQLVHAFAMSVHKSQGSEFRVVILSLLKAHYLLLQRNLLYTAITRARERCVIVGQSVAVAMAARNNQVTKRYGALGLRLAQTVRQA